MIRVFLALLVLGVTAQAGTNTIESVFSPKSILPQELKVLVLNHIEQHCQQPTGPYTLEERNTDWNDDEMVYLTVFFYSYRPDGTHPMEVPISIKSAKRDSQYGHGYELEIRELSAPDYICK